MVKHMIKISEFSETPYGRYKEDGNYCGEIFRDKYLKPALENARADNSQLIIDIDDVEGYGSSFLEEVFGGLIRLNLVPSNIDAIRKQIKIIFREPYFSFYEGLIWEYIEDEVRSK